MCVKKASTSGQNGHFFIDLAPSRIFHAIQNGGRIDPKTGRLIKAGDREKPFIPTPRQEKLISIIKKNDRVTTDEMKEDRIPVSLNTLFQK